MNNELIKNLRKCHESLVDDSGNKKSKADSYLINTSDKNLDIISSILGVVLRSNNISVETKMFITNKDWSIKDVNEYINGVREDAQSIKRERVRPLSYNNTVLKISGDNSKLSEILNSGLIKDLIYNRIEDYSEAEKVVNSLICEYGDCDNSRSNLLLDIKTDKLSCNSYKNNEEFFEILGSIESYLVQRKEIVERALNSNKEFVEYFNYLLNKESAYNKEVERDRERLLRFLNNEDYITGYVNEAFENNEDIYDIAIDEENNHIIRDSNYEEDGVEL